MLRFAFATCGLLLLGGAGWAQTPPTAVPPTPAAPSPTVPAPAVPPAIPAPKLLQAPVKYEVPDYAGAVWEAASPSNFQPSDRPSAERPIDRIVIHDIEGSAISAVRWFQNPQAQASSHYVIGADGTVYQMIKERDIAWHAGDRPTNYRSVGIEHNGFAYRPGFYNPVEYEASAKLVRQIALRYNIPRDREHIIGHFEVPDTAHPGHFGGRSGHTDPGPYWDWDSYMALVRNDATPEGALFRDVNVRPGEVLLMPLNMRNTGDDAWLADVKDQPSPELRQQGLVYVGLASPPSGPYQSASWISPLLAAKATGGDTQPGQVAKFMVPLQGPPVVPEPGANREQQVVLRLYKVPVAPRQPVAFGVSVPLMLRTLPWEIAVGAPHEAPAGWQVKETPDGMRTIWRNTRAESRALNPVGYQAVLPIAGFYDVYVRFTSGSNRTKDAQYRVTGADGVKSFTVDQRTGGNTWRKLGRVRFAAPVLSGPGVRPGQAGPAASPIVALVEAMGGGSGGIVATGDVRLEGPFAAPVRP